MEIITSLDNKKIKNLTKLNQKKYRDEEGKFLVSLEHLVIEADKNNSLLEVICVEDYPRKFNVPTTYVSYDVLKKLTDTLHPEGIVGVCRKLEEGTINNKVLILDDIQDPGNLGTIIRSAVAFNIDTICLSLNTVDVYNDKVLRASEGMVFNINIVRRDTKELINELKSNNYAIYGTKVDGGTNVRNFKVSNRFALVMGNEGRGVSSNILDLCDDYLYITMDNKCESLNVAIATSIILYELNL